MRCNCKTARNGHINFNSDLCNQCLTAELRKFPRPSKTSGQCVTNEIRNAKPGEMVVLPQGVSINDVVRLPNHYRMRPVETREAIKKALTREEFRGYIIGNVMKYTLRAPFKGNARQDIAKAQEYLNWFKEEFPDEEIPGITG